ncbi:MAG: hypothetical protein AAFN93_20560 [Bacteroidota bacterium]
MLSYFSYTKYTLITSVLFLAIAENIYSQGCTIKLSGFNQETEIAYLGVTNRINFDPLLEFSQVIDCQVENGEVFIDEFGYQYRPSYIGNTTIKIFKQVDGIMSLVDSCKIQIDYLPFTLYLGYRPLKPSDKIEVNKTQLLSQTFSLESTNTNLSAFARILEFAVRVERNNQTIFQSNYGLYNKQTDRGLKHDLSMLEKDDIVYITQLKYSYIDDHIIDYTSICIKVI